MMQRNLSGEDIKRDWTRISDISPYMIQAVMAGEDGRFCEHTGIDWKAIKQAMSDNETRARRRGGSTITQQTAKNVFFWNGGGLLRKAGEAWFASLIDFTWGKTRVMEMYLNVAEWGDGIFGVESAAQTRFGKSAKDLTKREAALLASVLPSPNKWRLDPPTDYVTRRASVLQKRMAVIRSSHYAKCVSGQKQETLPRQKTPTPKRSTPATPPSAPKIIKPETPAQTESSPETLLDEPLIEESFVDDIDSEIILIDEEDRREEKTTQIRPELSLEDVLERAEKSLQKEAGQTDGTQVEDSEVVPEP